jgi:hypothetical protein
LTRLLRSYDLTPVLVAAVAAAVVWVVALRAREDLGPGRAGWLFLAGSLVLASAGWFRWRLRGEREELARLRAEVSEERAQLDSWRKSLDDDAVVFEKRRQGFEKRLMTYHEWMEFPNLDAWGNLERVPEGVDERDRQVLAKVQEAADRILEGFRTDRFSENGKFEPRLLGNEVADLVRDVARVYQPQANEPLLETSLEKILKAANHISLHLLFHLEQLPFNLKDYSLARAYEHFRTASRLHAAYKSVSPYLPYANYTWQLGRIVMGANPLVTGTWILGSELIRRTGAKLSKVYMDRYTLKLTGETVRVIANEAAMIFDEDFRYRDASWIYGLELVEMVRFFPLSRETLQEALREIGSLPLRNSYDRIFLYRCVAAGRSPSPQAFVRASVLSIEQRRQIAERLERFFRHHLHGRRSDRVAEWSVAASERLGVSLQVGLGGTSVRESDEAIRDALASLSAFLFAVKERTPEEAKPLLEACRTAALLPEATRAEVVGALVSEPAMFFDYPNLDPENPLVPVYFGDLAELETRERPLDLQGLWAIREAATYFRLDLKAFEPAVLEAYGRHFTVDLLPSSPVQTIGADLALGLIRTLQPSERPLFLYPRAGVEEAEGVLGIRLPGLGAGGRPARWLVGTPGRLYVLEVNDQLQADDFHRHRITWILAAERCASGRVGMERCRGLRKSGCVIRGGEWTGEGIDNSRPEEFGLNVPDGARRQESYFDPLRDWLRRAGAAV